MARAHKTPPMQSARVEAETLAIGFGDRRQFGRRRWVVSGLDRDLERCPPVMGDREKKYRVVETDHMGGIFLGEWFAGPKMSLANAILVAETFNEEAGKDCLRRWKVELDGYELRGRNGS